MVTRRSLIKGVGTTVALAATGRALEGWAGTQPGGHTGAASSNPLATRDQLEMEDMAIRLYRSRPVEEAKARGRRLLQADPRAKTASGKSTLELDLNEIAFLACAITAIANPDDPKIYWGLNLPHRWFGRDVPGSRCGIDNPDNAYRLMAIDDQSSYIVTGQVPPVPPVDVSFTVFPVWPGIIDGKGVFPAALGGVRLADIEVDAAGAFTLTLDSSPANGRRNHLQLKPGACNLFVRDSMSDWARETPLQLSIKRVSGPPPKPPRDEAALIQLAAVNVERSVKFWMQLPEKYYYRSAPHQLSIGPNPAFATRGGQFTANGNFKLAPDEAYVLTLDPLGVGYVSVQLADLYGASLEYAHHTSSLSQSQMTANADGTITYVMSIKDPGVYNWLDTTGLDMGLFMFRYQGYDPDKFVPEKAIRTEQVVKLDQLRSVLPKETRWVTPEQRRQQLTERLAAYNRRLAEVPPAA